ncbi:DUF4147 domain-containing protein [Jiella sonneratiae]|uniref:DUF4147 domain-containing protein n=1 Tax=Jiella sonneratiae TaxID=2816856 RepID=A0ABS3J2H2_9HYPH|nr:DUF4147 domain-containing protein [Jiella sonneratiae]
MSPEDLGPALRAAFAVAVAAADPAAAVRAAMAGHRAELASAGRVFVAALGKAASAMAEAAIAELARPIAGGVVVTTDAAARPVEGCRVVVGGHPLPDAGSAEGGAALLALAEEAGEGDLLLALISGGGSALGVAPREGLGLADKTAVTDLLLRSGADITEMNTVRRALSRLKGGGLAEAAAPAKVLSLIVSDVPGDDPATVASGPTAPSHGGPSAREVLERYRLTDRLPPAVIAALDGGTAQPPSGHALNQIVASNARSVEAVARHLERQGFRVVTRPGWLGGDVAGAVAEVFALLHDEAAAPGPVAVVAGGETTVQVTGDGLGGRNQEFALRFALAEADRPLKRPWAFLAGGTDGRDGPTDAAGGIVDGETLRRMKAAGADPARHLARNDAYHALAAADSLLTTGATGTNVADVEIALML